MKKVIFLITAFAVTALFYSCTKENIAEEYQIGIHQTDNDVSLRGPKPKKRAESACQIDNQSGIECIGSPGYECKRIKPCAAISDFRVADFFTLAELSNWSNIDYKENRKFMLHMWEIGWFHHPNDIERWERGG